MDEITLNAFAKINLSLDVLRRREDGYHDVKMVMQNVRMYDRVFMEKKRTEGISLTANLSFLPLDDKNLMVRAARLMFDEFKLPGGLSMSLEKRIPVAAGMAGGSSDASSVLYGINRLYDLNLSLQELQKLGLKLGADVPFCLMRHTALAEGIGEILSPLPFCPECSVVLAKPPVSLSTKTVYENLHIDENTVHPNTDAMIEALKNQDLKGVAENLGNVLEDVSLKLVPEIGQIKEFMKENGALNALMSGSGPTVFGLFDSEKRARICAEKLRERSFARMVRVVGMFVQR